MFLLFSAFSCEFNVTYLRLQDRLALCNYCKILSKNSASDWLEFSFNQSEALPISG